MENVKNLFKKGQKVKINITAVNGHGEGIGHIRYDDSYFTIFVPGGKKDETVTVEITQLHETYLVGKKS